jgi:hypothetical protein
MNTNMNMKIYTGLGHQSVICYAQCENMFPLLILEGSTEEHIMGEISSLGMLWVCSSGLERARWLGPPFIDNWEGLAIYPSVHHECRVLTHMAGQTTCRVHPSPYVGLGNHHCVASCPLRFARGGGHLERIITTYPCRMSHLLNLMHHWPRATCLDTVWRPIHWSVCTSNDVLACCHLCNNPSATTTVAATIHLQYCHNVSTVFAQ